MGAVWVNTRLLAGKGWVVKGCMAYEKPADGVFGVYWFGCLPLYAQVATPLFVKLFRDPSRRGFSLNCRRFKITHTAIKELLLIF